MKNLKTSCLNLRGFLSFICLFFLLGLCFFGGAVACSSQGVKMADDLKTVKEEVQKLNTKMSVQGDNNKQIFQTLTKKVDTTIQNTEKTSQQVKDGASATAEKIEEFNSSVKNTKNSTFLMIVLFAMVIFTFGGLFYLIIKHVLLKQKVKRVFVSPDNDLTEEKWKALK